MKNMIKLLLLFLFFGTSNAQVGIGTTSPEGALDINSSTMGVVIPRVSSLEAVTDASGTGPAVNGTFVYDELRDKICQRIKNKWVCTGIEENGSITTSIVVEVEDENSTYFKSSNSETNDSFGFNVSITNDGSRLAIGATLEGSNATGINGDQTDNSAHLSGAVYVFRRSGTTWIQEAYVKASNTDIDDRFGTDVSLSGDGTRLAITAPREASNAVGINGDQTDNSAVRSGAVYVFVRTGTTWTQEAYIKASNAESGDFFGIHANLSDDGSRLAVAAEFERSNATGINGDQTDNSAPSAGAAYIFVRTGTTWTQEAYLKASNTQSADLFGTDASLSGDGTRVVITASREDSIATGVNGNQTDNSAPNAGAVYVFRRSGTTWTQEAYVKASNTNTNYDFGSSISMNADGTRMVVGSRSEGSNAMNVNGDQTNNLSNLSGAAYVFIRSGTTWTQEAYLKAFNTESIDRFGDQVDISGDGSRIVIAALGEDSGARGINGDENDNTVSNSGAIYEYERTGTTWTPGRYIKSSNSDSEDRVANSIDLSLDGGYMIMGASREDSNATGIGGDQINNSNGNSGAAYLVHLF